MSPISTSLCVSVCLCVLLSLSSGEVWSDWAQDCSLSRLLVSKVPVVSRRVRDVTEVCVILDVGLQRGAGVNTASYIQSAISLSIKSGNHTPQTRALTCTLKNTVWTSFTPKTPLMQVHFSALFSELWFHLRFTLGVHSIQPFHPQLIILLHNPHGDNNQKIPHTFTCTP